MKKITGKGRLAMRRGNSGVSLLEMVIAMAIIAFALFGMISVISYTTRSNLATQERQIAMRAAEKQIETMLNMPAIGALGRFSSFTGNSSYMIGTTPLGVGLDVPDLHFKQVAGRGVGQILFVNFPCTDPVTGIPTPNQLLEKATNTFLELGAGVFLDLNGNGFAGENGDRSVDYIMLPCIIEVNWMGVYGKSQLIYKYTFHN
jgi:type II secretory pathway pseudopilin PulG